MTTTNRENYEHRHHRPEALELCSNVLRLHKPVVEQPQYHLFHRYKTRVRRLSAAAIPVIIYYSQ